MELTYTKTGITFSKERTALDNFVIDFTSVLNTLNVTYVIVSGYVSILFGRNRSSEDVDLLIEPFDKPSFQNAWNVLTTTFECLNTKDSTSAYKDYLTRETAIRFSYKQQYIPNIECKFPKNDLDQWTLDKRKQVLVNDHTLYISPLELQIPYKLYLGSEKDIEDAKYLYDVFKDHLDEPLLKEFNRKLKTDKTFNCYLK